MPDINITSLSDPGVELFSSLTEAQLCDRRLVANELFIAETAKVIDTALDAGYKPFSMLTRVWQSGLIIRLMNAMRCRQMLKTHGYRLMLNR